MTGEESSTAERAETLLRRADRARREGRSAEARGHLVEAVALRRRAGTPADLVRALERLGHVELDLSHHEEARRLYEEAVAVCRAEGDPLGLAHTVRHLGDVHRHVGRLDLAEPCYREALELYRSEKAPPTLDLANALRPLAILEEALGGRDAARRLWEEAKVLYAEVGVREGVAECEARLAALTV